MSDTIARARHAQERFSLEIPYALTSQGVVPTAMPLLPGGKTIKGRDGRAYTHKNALKTLQVLEDAFKDYPMVLDENHSLENAAPNGEPSPALARMSAFALRADGSIWATKVDWTPYGLDRLAQRAYVGVSPTVLFDLSQATEQDGIKIDGEILSIANAGLVNEPNFVMPALHSKSPKMNEEQIKKLVQDAIAAGIAGAVTSIREEFTAGIADLRTQVTAGLEGVQAEAKASHSARVTTVIARALAAKRIAPASKDYHSKRLNTAADVAEFEAAYLVGAPEDETVVSNDRPARARHVRNAGAAESKVKNTLAANMGVKPEDMDGEDEPEDLE